MLEFASIDQNIVIIHKYFKQYFKNELKPYDLNAAEGMVLFMLFVQKDRADTGAGKSDHQETFGKTQEQIVDELHYDKSVMARTMQSLETKGYVLRNDNPQDSRSYIFTPTQAAMAFKPVLLSMIKRWHDSMLKDVEHLDVIKTAIKKMAVNVQEMIKEP